MKRTYVIYDSRALQDIDSATVLQSGLESLQEAKICAKDFAPCVIYSYSPDGRMLTDEKFELSVK